MRAVDALMECLKAEGVDVVFGLPGGANLPDLRRLRQRRHPPHPRPPRGRRRARRRGLREGHRQGRRRVRDQRPGRDQPDHADLRRDDGLGAGRVHHRPGAHRAARHRRLPGGRHDRHHDAGRQALVHDPAPAGAPAGDPRGVPHRPQRDARDRCSSTSRRTCRARRSTTSRSPTCACPATSRRRGQPEADPPGREGARRGAAPGDLRRRRRRQRERLGGAARVRTLRPLPGDLHADGPRRVSRARAPDPVAGDARHARHARGQLRDGRGRPDLRGRRALRRPHHRQALGVRAAREVHPHRRRPGGDLQERAGAHPDRRRRQARARQAASSSTARSAPTRRAWTRGGADRRLESQVPARLRGQRPTPRSSRST